MRNQGMPDLHNGKRGNQFVKIDVFIPTKLSNNQKNLFEEFAKESPEMIISKFKEEASNWIEEKDLIDDVTFVVIKVK